MRSRLLTALLPAMALPLLGALVYFNWWSDRPEARWIYTGVKIFTVLWPFIAVKWILKEPFLSFSLKGFRQKNTVILGLGSGAAIGGAMLLLMQTPVGDMVRANSEAIRQKTEDLGVLDHYWLFAVFLCLIHSLIEEYYWRWFLFGRLRRLLPTGWAHAAAGAAFAAHHIVVTLQYFPAFWGWTLGAAVGVGGVIWSVLYQRQQTLAGVWLSHLIVDAAIMGIGYQLIFSS